MALGFESLFEPGETSLIVDSPKLHESGWEYVRLESVETYIAGNAGCLCLGARGQQFRPCWFLQLGSAKRRHSPPPATA